MSKTVLWWSVVDFRESKIRSNPVILARDEMKRHKTKSTRFRLSLFSTYRTFCILFARFSAAHSHDPSHETPLRFNSGLNKSKWFLLIIFIRSRTCFKAVWPGGPFRNFRKFQWFSIILHIFIIHYINCLLFGMSREWHWTFPRP